MAVPGSGVSNNQWLYLSPQGLGQPGTVNISGGGGEPLLSGYRSIEDARRSAATPRIPQAEYPDGYLGNVNSRREDKLLGAVQSRLTQRSYQRGVHKGERVDPQDYYWNDQVNPQAALIAEAKGLKWTQVGSTPMEQINHMGKNHLLAPQDFDKIADSVGLQSPQEIDPVRSARAQRLMPTWR